jgi:integrase
MNDAPFRFRQRSLSSSLSTSPASTATTSSSTADGGPLRHSNWYPRHFKPAVRRADLPEGTRFHDLRHTYAAMLIEQGAHPRAMMERLGHSTIQVTLGTYGHLFPNLEESLDHALNTVFTSAEPKSAIDVAALADRATG